MEMARLSPPPEDVLQLMVKIRKTPAPPGEKFAGCFCIDTPLARGLFLAFLETHAQSYPS
jgi:hypothetical protein